MKCKRYNGSTGASYKTIEHIKNKIKNNNCEFPLIIAFLENGDVYNLAIPNSKEIREYNPIECLGLGKEPMVWKIISRLELKELINTRRKKQENYE